MLELGQGRRGGGRLQLPGSQHGIAPLLGHRLLGLWLPGRRSCGYREGGAKVINLGVLIGTGVISSGADWHSV